MWTLKRVLYVALLLCLFSLPGTTVEAEKTYTVTETQLSELQVIYTTLKTQSEEQQTLLTEQKSQIKTLKTRLKTSSKEISSSKTQLSQAQEQLTALEQSWKKSDANRQRTEVRLERQRNTWAIVAAVAVGAAISGR